MIYSVMVAFILTLPHSVMVARQNLTLLVQVRVLMRQQIKGTRLKVEIFEECGGVSDIL